MFASLTVDGLARKLSFEQCSAYDIAGSGSGVVLKSLIHDTSL